MDRRKFIVNTGIVGAGLLGAGKGAPSPLRPEVKKQFNKQFKLGFKS
jgi:hypothetical protein